MAKEPRRLEEIVAKLRQVEVLQLQGMAAADATRQIGVSEVIYYRWRKEFGGMGAD
jgi:transposase